jgi:PTH1 family peptidyl-tRNA hydrolase
MNLSGTAVRYWMDKEKIVKDNILVVTDDLNLPLATLRLKKKGSDGGHNGLKNIQQKLNSNVYPRLRIGVGNDFSKGKQIDYVLGDWSAEELVIVEDKIETIKEMILGFCFNGLNNTMNTYNNK